MKRILVTDKDYYEKEVNAQDIKKEGKGFKANGEEILFTNCGFEDYELFLQGALYALDKKIIREEIEQILARFK